jgi:ethanolaminephosphotransferase
MGNHGGSTEGETAAALLFAAPSRGPSFQSSPPPAGASPYRYHQVVNQIDLVPTLSVLFGLGIPT